MKWNWDARIDRAGVLISQYPFAAEALGFYARTAALQRNLYTEFEKELGTSPHLAASGRLRDDLDSILLLSKFSNFLGAIEPIAPNPLAQAAAGLLHEDSARWRTLIEDFWDCDSLLQPEELSSGAISSKQEPDANASIAAENCLAWLFLQPYAEYLATRRCAVLVDGTPSICPVCGAKPIVGVLRPEGDGAKKSLICMLCAHEWTFRRICCPGCGEEREPQMAFYSAPEIPHVRVDVCDTCHAYLKSVDLTKAGRAVPVIDELATLPLDLWARENGYAKLQLNILGM